MSKLKKRLMSKKECEIYLAKMTDADYIKKKYESIEQAIAYMQLTPNKITTMTKQKKVHILKGKGKYKKQFRFKLVAPNGKILSDRDFYERKSTLKNLLKKYFTDFQIVDDTAPTWEELERRHNSLTER